MVILQLLTTKIKIISAKNQPLKANILSVIKKYGLLDLLY